MTRLQEEKGGGVEVSCAPDESQARIDANKTSEAAAEAEAASREGKTLKQLTDDEQGSLSKRSRRACERDTQSRDVKERGGSTESIRAERGARAGRLDTARAGDGELAGQEVKTRLEEEVVELRDAIKIEREWMRRREEDRELLVKRLEERLARLQQLREEAGGNGEHAPNSSLEAEVDKLVEQLAKEL